MILEKPRNVVAATITTLGPGAALSFYLAGVGFFVVRFNSRNVLLWMLLAVYSPFPVALLLQEKFDAGFDKAFTTRVTFFFRVIVVPLMMAVLIGVLALLCTTWIAVLLCGLFLGFFFAATLGSSLQMVSAWDPLLVVWAQIGNTVGATAACLAFFIFSFAASRATKVEFQVILLVPIGIICIISATLMYWHFKYDLFDHVFRRLAYDLSEDPKSEDIPSLLPLTRGTSAEAQVYAGDDVNELGVPLWVPWYNCASAVNTFMSFMLLPFATYFGDADLAQMLVLAKFAMDFGGRLAALVWGLLYEDLREPIHAEVIFQLISRLAVGIVLALGLFDIVRLHRAAFLTLWCFFFVDGTYLASQIDILITRCTVVGQRKAVARSNAFLGFCGLFVALWTSLAVVYFSSAFQHDSF